MDWSEPTWCQASSTAQEGELYDLLWTSNATLLISHKARGIFDGVINPEHVQYLPISVLDSSGRSVATYDLVNLLAKLDAVDFAASDAKLMSILNDETGMPCAASFKKLVLKKSAVTGFDAFRCKRYYTPWFLSDRLAMALAAANCTGFATQTVEAR